MGAKADAEVNCVRPTRQYNNVTLVTGAKVERLHTNAAGTEVKCVEAKIDNQKYLFYGDLVVLSCGTVNSAALLLRSGNDSHPNGLANSSDQVGRNYMKHLSTAMVALSDRPNESVHQKAMQRVAEVPSVVATASRNYWLKRLLLGRTRFSLSKK